MTVADRNLCRCGAEMDLVEIPVCGEGCSCVDRRFVCTAIDCFSVRFVEYTDPQHILLQGAYPGEEDEGAY